STVAKPRDILIPAIETQRFGSWVHASGRIWVLEKDLLGRSGLDRLYAAASFDEIRGLLLEHRYPQKDTLHEMLQAEAASLYEFLEEAAPDDGYRAALLLPADAHNLRVMLRESLHGEKAHSYRSLEKLVKQPSLINPETLWRALVSREREVALPPWLQAAADRAREAYAEQYDAVSIDLSVERDFHDMLRLIASKTRNEWFETYFTMVRDLTNLETLLRCRLRRCNESLYAASLLSDGAVTKDQWALFQGGESDIAIQLEATPYRAMTAFVASYGERGVAAAFSRERDLLLYRHLSSGSKQLSSAERVLSYIMAREVEIRNIRIMMSALSDTLSGAEYTVLRRDYME
ncbi:MAG TPA: V-type ATPase subunit, partial [Bacillota bacterium]|nr:V-type ATPase subunit [Bacillota bacterium]